MKLMIIVLSDVDKLDPLLEAMMEDGIKGATILNSTGMARELYHVNEDFPIFGSLSALLDPDRQENRTVFMALQDEQVPVVKRIVTSIVGDLSQPDTAILFTLPILDVEGIVKD